MKYNNLNQLIKVITYTLLIIITIICYTCKLIENYIFFLIVLLCAYMLINSLYYFFNTGLIIKGKKLKICYVDSLSTLMFPKINKYIIDIKDIIKTEKVVDKYKATCYLSITTDSQNYYLKNMFFDNQLNKIIDFFNK